ncbi:hypothetical protein GWI33_001998 [Rhynchophorus ferrugineus]|uniref:Uncharacterized protein n=1 Tax=Rhynchophorus ferrugineus TaxID=354439 RepID=A0A834IKP7_RHYFE|nr:hypothetical protein GWI33_001998 [Rhynchophorus ferrugineus]
MGEKRPLYKQSAIVGATGASTAPKTNPVTKQEGRLFEMLRHVFHVGSCLLWALAASFRALNHRRLMRFIKREPICRA